MAHREIREHKDGSKWILCDGKRKRQPAWYVLVVARVSIRLLCYCSHHSLNLNLNCQKVEEENACDRAKSFLMLFDY